jgi:hypothetical protein
VRISAIGLSVIFLFAAGAYGQQCPVMPAGTVCISQSAANVAMANSRELAATKEKVAVLEEGLREKDKSIQELKDANQKNVLDLTIQLSKVTVEAALEKGRAEQCNADKVLWSAVIPVLVQNTRQKTNGIKIF